VDGSGFFCRTFDAEVVHAAGLDPAFAQDSLSRSAHRVVRSFELRDAGQVSLYVPSGCARGFQALTEPAERRPRLKVNREKLPYHRGVIT